MLAYMYTKRYDSPTLLAAAVFYVGELTVINVNSMGYLASLSISSFFQISFLCTKFYSFIFSSKQFFKL